jgi:hypothetical protein
MFNIIVIVGFRKCTKNTSALILDKRFQLRKISKGKDVTWKV